MSSLVEAALRHAAHGRPVFPCEPRGKRPIIPEGLNAASTSPATIRQWWAQRPDANLGLRTGAVSRLVVLDIDGDVGAESLQALEHEHGRLPRTASVVTPRGGAHFYFKHPGTEVRNSAGTIGAGIDMRGDGGYVLAPPSVGANRRTYEPDENIAPADLPGWLLGRVSRPTAGARVPVGEWVGIVRNGLPEGQRNHGLARVTGHLLAKQVHPYLVRELVRLVAARCHPPLEAAEADRIVESIAARELRK